MTEITIQIKQDQALIPNSQIEEMFLRVCTDSEIKTYTRLVNEGHIALATAYASNKVSKLFHTMVDELEKLGKDVNKIKK